MKLSIEVNPGRHSHFFRCSEGSFYLFCFSKKCLKRYPFLAILGFGKQFIYCDDFRHFNGDQKAFSCPLNACCDEQSICTAFWHISGTDSIKKLEDKITETHKKITEIMGVKESDTGLSQPSHWDQCNFSRKSQECFLVDLRSDNPPS